MIVPRATEAAFALYGAWRLARFDPAGLGYFGTKVEDFWKSFFAAVLIAPGYVILVALHLSKTGIHADFLSVVLIQALAYVVSWLAFPVVMDPVSEALGREHRYRLYIVAFNWIKVLQMVVYLPVTLLAATGLLPEAFAGVLTVTVALAILAYSWFTTKVALEVRGPAAAALVFLDLGLSLLITGLADAAVG